MAVVEEDLELRVPRGIHHAAVHFEGITLGHQCWPPLSTMALSASLSSCPQRIGRRLFGSLAVRLIAELPQILR
jgi:hypothetical protein